MYSTTVYLYQQKHQVIIVDTSGSDSTFSRRYAPVYSKKLTINKGVDNVILFEFVNQDQKYVNVEGSSFVFRVLNQEGTAVLYTKDMVAINPKCGRVKVVIDREDFVNVQAQPGGWSIQRSSGVLVEPIMVNDYASARGMVDIVDSVFPQFETSQTMTIPTQPSPPAGNPNRNHTSEVYVGSQRLVTFQLDFDNFTGNVIAQGSDSYLGPWYNIGLQHTYVSQRERDAFNVEGNHNWLRFEINQWGSAATGNVVVGTSGSITSLSGGGGNNYYGVVEPRVNIVGVGTGALANGTAANNTVTSLNLIDGGEGFVPSLQPHVVIDDGAITHIKFR